MKAFYAERGLQDRFAALDVDALARKYGGDVVVDPRFARRPVVGSV